MPRFAPVFLLPILALSQGTFAQPLPDRAPMAGVVFDAAGAPVAEAYLVLRRRDAKGSFGFWGAATQADANGTWSLPDAEEGAYYLNVEVPNYAPIQNLPVDWKRGAAPLQLRMTRLVELTLRLRAPDGSPVEGAPVYAGLRASQANASLSRSTPSNGQGDFAVPNVPPGQYRLYVRAPQGFALRDVTIGELGAPVSLDLNLQAPGTLRARLTDSKGRALGGAALTLTAEASNALAGEPGEDFALLVSGNDRNALVTRDGDGLVELEGLPPGRYTPRFYLPGYAPVPIPAVEIKAGETAILEAKLPALDTPTLTLDLRTQKDEPYRAGEVTLRILPLADNGAMGGDGLPFFPGGPGGRRALPDDKGRITLFPVKPGRYRVFAEPRPKSDNPNRRDAVPVDVTITAQGATATVVMP